MTLGTSVKWPSNDFPSLSHLELNLEGMGVDHYWQRHAGKQKNPGNKKPLSSLSTKAHQPRGAVLRTIIKAKALPATTMAAAL
ncbi:hypothetical protein C3F00_025765 [Pseudomonas sp. MWU13-2860]|nr:hypothetical protein C3F00_025765 [Pseudomonas sp. MWU13-2860]